MNLIAKYLSLRLITANQTHSLFENTLNQKLHALFITTRMITHYTAYDQSLLLFHIYSSMLSDNHAKSQAFVREALFLSICFLTESLILNIIKNQLYCLRVNFMSLHTTKYMLFIKCIIHL